MYLPIIKIHEPKKKKPKPDLSIKLMHWEKKKKATDLVTKYNPYESLLIVKINTYGGLEATQDVLSWYLCVRASSVRFGTQNNIKGSQPLLIY